MRWLAAILLIGVFLRHDTSFFLSKFTRFSPSEWFYLLGGVWEVVLCGILRARVRGYFAVAAMWIGMLEGGQIAVCQALLEGPVPAGVSECDYIAGWPVGEWIVGLELVILFIAAATRWQWGSRLWSS